MNEYVIAGVVTNILSVVCIVITNKYITEVDGFHFMVFLSFLHVLFTTIGTSYAHDGTVQLSACTFVWHLTCGSRKLFVRSVCDVRFQCCGD